MDAARRAICTDDLLNPIVTTFMQSCGMLFVSHVFHLVLKPLGQPGPVAQILAGVVLGPSLLCRIKHFREVFIQPNLADYNFVVSFIFRILLMFLIGLEVDIAYLRRNLRQASIIACGGMIVCSIFGAAVSYFIMTMLKISEHQFAFANIIMIILASSASPVVIRLVAELKFDTADIGRFAVVSCLVNELSCILWYAIFVGCTSRKMFGKGILCLVLTIAVTILNRFLVFWSNRRNQNEKYVTGTDISTILCLIIALSFLIEEAGYDSTISCFLIGIMFPRKGKTTRTLSHKLTYAVNNFILPIYFGFNGFRFDISYLSSIRNFVVVMLVIVLSAGGKIIGTLAACHYLKIPRNEGVILAFILNLKGHGELLLIDVVPRSITWWNENFHSLVIIAIVLNTVISGPVVSSILRREERYFAHGPTSLEFNDPDKELRMLFCVYDSRHISEKLGLISALSGSGNAPLIPYLMHLVELPSKRTKTKLMYHQLEDGDQFSDEEDYGGNDVLQINDSVDAFATDNEVLIRQHKIVSLFQSMHEDVCNAAEDLRVSIIFVAFHKHQRLDGKLESSKGGLRITNQKVIRHAPCSVGIFVDRGQTGFQQPCAHMVQNVATLFFGGPDDREALACSQKIALHPYVKLTIVRFLPLVSEKRWEHTENEEILISASNSEVDQAMDDVSVGDFYNRYVVTGQVAYVEKHVKNGAEIVEAIREIGDMYSLFIVGKAGRTFSPLMADLSDWEECPELGTVGDLLASSELDINASVLVIQQHRQSRQRGHLMDD